MAKEQKTVLEKYYISEAFDKDRNISFNFKKANKGISGNFLNFSSAVEEFIKVSENTQNPTKCWFHRDGAYRGCVNIDGARVIVEKVAEKQVKNEEAIEFIEREQLVEKPAAKAKKVEEPKQECECSCSCDCLTGIENNKHWKEYWTKKSSNNIVCSGIQDHKGGEKLFIGLTVCLSILTIINLILIILLATNVI